MKLIFKAVFVLILVSSNASAWPTRDHFNAMYQECVTREGGYLTNGIISMCTNEVLVEVIDRLELRVEEMSQPEDYDQVNERFEAYDLEQRTLFQSGVEDYKKSIVQVCNFMGYHVGGPANPLCVMDMMVNLVTILERYD
ncbi:hypothetical protein [Nitrincola lacisaponensis]|uniref:hypothetical protein n=1 Tax=Nitrincola lacisaponensis TaxID=267850 RepID=UPI0005607527|nr:hypothetical protein [Nitrincola lacisaponensis]